METARVRSAIETHLGPRDVPRWYGQTVVCAASGPSLTAADLTAVQGKARVIVVNATFRLAPWADALYGADETFWKQYLPEIRSSGFAGELWTCSARGARELGLSFIKANAGRGYSVMPGQITTGGNSGYQALHLAALWGARRVILLGYDMQRTGGREHWHGKHEGGLRNGRNFGFWVRRFQPLARDLRARRVEVINCTRETALNCFARRDLEAIAW
jgi:hypothetical protein